MMTLEMVLELLAQAESDLFFDDELFEGELSVTVHDFDGFDEDWSEVMRDLDNAKLVDKVYETLKAEAIEVSGDFYEYFDFGDFVVCWGYSSFDI